MEGLIITQWNKTHGKETSQNNLKPKGFLGTILELIMVESFLGLL